jgi:hypothetical protein
MVPYDNFAQHLFARSMFADERVKQRAKELAAIEEGGNCSNCKYIKSHQFCVKKNKILFTLSSICAKWRKVQNEPNK